MLDYILNNHRCTVSEIMKELNLCSSTLYHYIDKIFEIGLIDKEPSSGRNKNGAHFNLIAKPELENYLKEFSSVVLEFSNNL